MSFGKLPTEILDTVSEDVDAFALAHLVSLTRTSRRLHAIANSFLYKTDARASGSFNSMYYGLRTGLNSVVKLCLLARADPRRARWCGRGLDLPGTPCMSQNSDDQLWPAGRHVPQTSGEPSRGLPEWIGDGSESIENTDIVLWHTFGVTHIPAPEDFPVMPAEPMTLLLRPRNFFTNNPVMNVPPSYVTIPSQIAAKKDAVVDATDKVSKMAFNESCCAGSNGTNGSNGVH